jgi:hypothetical protein
MREKVIMGLERCIEKLNTVTNKTHGFNCTACPYFKRCDSSGYLLGLPLMKDALALLKAQEPRVMTLEEVKASKGDDMFLEISTRTDEIPYITAATLDGAGTKGVVFYCSHLDYVAYNRRLYGWRCWTSRPTDEQRKAAKWE